MSDIEQALTEALAATITDYDKPWHAKSILAHSSMQTIVRDAAVGRAVRDGDMPTISAALHPSLGLAARLTDHERHQLNNEVHSECSKCMAALRDDLDYEDTAAVEDAWQKRNRP